MLEGGTVFVDYRDEHVYFLGGELLLMRAPARGEVAFGGEGQVVRASRDPAQSARHAAVRAALLRSAAGPDAQRLPQVGGELVLAQALAAQAGIAVPSLSDGRFVRVTTTAEMELPVGPIRAPTA